MAIAKRKFNKEYFRNINKEIWEKECKNLNDGESKILYFCEEEKICVRINKIGKKVFTVRTSFGEMDIRECIKNMMIKEV
ncbi:MAG: hypothetical protein ACRCWM_07720 [Sarcina sp.]